MAKRNGKPVQMELKLNEHSKKQTYTNHTGKKRNFPIAEIQKRLIGITRARQTRITAEERARVYMATITDLQKRFGKPTKNNAKAYLKKINHERLTEEAISKSFKTTGTDKELSETHAETAEIIQRYISALEKHFKIK